MEPRILRILLLIMTATVLLFASAVKSYADSVEATIEYKYDEVGNIIEKKVTYTAVPGSTDTSLPITIASPGGNTYNSPWFVTLSCYIQFPSKSPVPSRTRVGAFCKPPATGN